MRLHSYFILPIKKVFDLYKYKPCKKIQYFFFVYAYEENVNIENKNNAIVSKSSKNISIFMFFFFLNDDETKNFSKNISVHQGALYVDVKCYFFSE